MQYLKICLPFTVFLVACAPGKDSRYRDTELLERPPTLAVSKQPDAAAECCDDAVIPKKKAGSGLGDDAYLVATKPMQLKIKQPADTAWNTLGLALARAT